MRQISTTIHQVNESLDEIVWAVNPRNDRLPDLVNHIGQYALDFLQTAGIRCRLELPDQTPDGAMTPEARHNLFLVTKEALNNIARHAKATEVRLHAATSNGSILITIEDNGCGFYDPPPNNGSSDGLINMRQRMDNIGGGIKIESAPGSGTRIQLNFPLFRKA